jgi:TrkA-C domain
MSRRRRLVVAAVGTAITLALLVGAMPGRSAAPPGGSDVVVPGVSIVAVVRGQTALPAPTPSFGFQPGDTAVVVGTPAGVRALARLLEG